MGCKKKHKDDSSFLKILVGCDHCKFIKTIGKLSIELNQVNNLIEDSNNSDWYGYKRIDKFKKSIKTSKLKDNSANFPT